MDVIYKVRTAAYISIVLVCEVTVSLLLLQASLSGFWGVSALEMAQSSIHSNKMSGLNHLLLWTVFFFIGALMEHFVTYNVYKYTTICRSLERL